MKMISKGMKKISMGTDLVPLKAVNVNKYSLKQPSKVLYSLKMAVGTKPNIYVQPRQSPGGDAFGDPSFGAIIVKNLFKRKIIKNPNRLQKLEELSRVQLLPLPNIPSGPKGKGLLNSVRGVGDVGGGDGRTVNAY